MRWMVPVVFLAGCASPQTAEPVDDRPVLTLGGAEAFTARLLPSLAETFVKSRNTHRFQIRRTDDDGMSSLLDGSLDVVATSRTHRARDQAQARENGFNLEAEGARHIVGVDVIALAVHASNPADSLTYDQVIGIFCEGDNRIDNWSFLGQENRPVRVVSADISSGTRMLFEDFFCGGRGLGQHVEVLNDQAIATALESDEAIISYVSMNQEAGKVLGLRPDSAQPPVRPSQQQVIRGAYPLYRDIFMYTRGPATGDVGSFMDWVMSPAGQDVVDEQRFVPVFLRPERLDEPRPLRETIHFEPGSSAPNQRSSARLALLVNELKERAGAYQHVVLEGYTDNQEPDRIALSQKRAEEVRKTLAAELPGTYFEIIPRGDDNPIAPNQTTYGRQRNRRVQIYLAEEEAAPQRADEEIVE